MSDNLYQPESIIKDAQNRAKKFFKSKESIFLVNGSTIGIQAAILGVCKPKEEILLCADCHKSAHNAILLAGLTARYIPACFDKKTGVFFPPTAAQIEKFCKKYPNIKAMFLTSPNYFGIDADIREIKKVLNKYNIILIIDAAHGAHYPLFFKDKYNDIVENADIVIHSIHKTLPSFTQSSILQVFSDNELINRVKDYIAKIQSSSPSYILMSSIDVAVDISVHFGDNLSKKLKNRVQNLEEFVDKLKKFEIFKHFNKDYTKIYILTENTGKTGIEIEKILADEFKIQVEMSNNKGILLISTISNNDLDFKNLKNALLILEKRFILNESILKDQDITLYPEFEVILNPFEAQTLSVEKILLKDAKNRILAENITPYPPGIPVLIVGSKITQKHIDFILKIQNEGVKILDASDLKNQKVNVFKI